MIIRNKKKMKDIIDSAKRGGKSVFIKRGTFDIIHPGHIYAIRKFKKIADVIIILIQLDGTVRSRKGNDRPINSQDQRMKVMDGIAGVDYVFADKTQSRQEYIDLLNYFQPNIVAVTKTDKEKEEAYSNHNWILKQFPDKKGPSYSTTSIVKRVLKQCV